MTETLGQVLQDAMHTPESDLKLMKEIIARVEARNGKRQQTVDVRIDVVVDGKLLQVATGENSLLLLWFRAIWPDHGKFVTFEDKPYLNSILNQQWVKKELQGY